MRSANIDRVTNEPSIHLVLNLDGVGNGVITTSIPFFGICLGMQCAVVEFARNMLGLEDAHSSEIKEYTSHPVIDLMMEQKSITDMGGTMRLGAYPFVASQFHPEYASTVLAPHPLFISFVAASVEKAK